MRTVTATEKYRAVNEGRMAKSEFVRQMRQQFPQFITQYNAYDDTVQILKNKQMIFEAPVVKEAFENMSVYADRPALNYPLDVYERGIAIELQSAGIEVHDKFNIKGEDLDKASKKAKANLDKDPNHYINLMAGESAKVDKHDREEEIKRGEGKIDVFNGMKKADLKEAKVMLKEGKLDDLAAKLGVDVDKLKKAADKIRDMEREKAQQDAKKLAEIEKAMTNDVVEEAPEMSLEEKKLAIGAVIDIIQKKYPNVSQGIALDFIKTHYEDLINGADPIAEFEEYVSVNTDYVDEAKTIDIYGDGDVVVNIDKATPEQERLINFEFEISEFGDSEEAQEVADQIMNLNSADEVENYYANVRGWDDSDDMRSMVRGAVDTFRGLDEKNIKEDFAPSPNSDIPDANAEDFDVATAFKKARVDMSKPVSVVYSYGHAQYSSFDRDEMSAEAAIKRIEADRQENRKNYTDDGREVPSDIHGYEFENYSVLEEDMPEGHEYKLSYYLDGDYTYSITQEKAGVSEKKGKDHDGDGDIDGDDYMAAKDKAIKKAMGKDESYAMKRMQRAHTQDRLAGRKSTYDIAKEKQKANQEKELKEAIKSIIKKTLNNQVLNEAATMGLASLSDQYDDLKGFKTAVIDLQNLVTEIESFNDRMKDKIQGVFNKTGDIENEDGLKVGAFLAPTIMNAFKKDLGPVMKGGYMKNIELPKTSIFKQQGPAVQEQPKQTVFGINEEKK